MGKEEKGKTRYAISEKDVIYEGGSCGGGRGRGIGSNQRLKSRPPPMCPRLSLSLSLIYTWFDGAFVGFCCLGRNVWRSLATQWRNRGGDERWLG